VARGPSQSSAARPWAVADPSQPSAARPWVAPDPSQSAAARQAKHSRANSPQGILHLCKQPSNC